MIAGYVDTRSSLDQLTNAYAQGDAPLGELLLLDVLDRGLPWDEVAAAAARGTARRYGAAADAELPRA